MKGFEIKTLQDCMTYVDSLIRGLPTLYSMLPKTSDRIRLQLIVNQTLDKCETAIEEENRKYLDIMRERSLKK
ncbi:MAG: hypothetical protein KGI11_09655 [Thaumarchaeota archaeon]|nr:hypothetical protein [Nitrososphaerota archaeon]